MAIKFDVRSKVTYLYDQNGELPPSIRSTLRFRGFHRKGEEYVCENDTSGDELIFARTVVQKEGLETQLSLAATNLIDEKGRNAQFLKSNKLRGNEIKNGSFDSPETREFIRFTENGLHRRLLPHQLKAAIHLLILDHAANFSVPGAGKTSVVLAVYEYLRMREIVNSIFVVGPRSCFMAWNTEFLLTLGRQPKTDKFAGGNAEDRHRRYFGDKKDSPELFLTTYQTLARDRFYVDELLRSQDKKIFLVLDEAHYVKQDEGVWAQAIAQISQHATKRCALTGTPFPKSYADGINLFEFLYPNSGLFSNGVGERIRRETDAKNHDVARQFLEPIVSNLFYRVRKQDLNLSEPVFVEPIAVAMKAIERKLYDYIDVRINELEKEPSDRDLTTILRLRRGRQIRRRQAVSHPTLLFSAIDDYDEELVDNHSIISLILNYDSMETTAKLDRLMTEIYKLRQRDEKVVVWANFVGTLHRIKDELDTSGLKSALIFGGTPTESQTDDDTRDEIIRIFNDASSGLDILIANPAACAESVSLHRSCSYAIYFDLSYNCAQYLQSLDRIHRVGGSERKISHYLFLRCANTFEHQILTNLSEKATRMSDLIDQDFPLAHCEIPSPSKDFEIFLE